MVPFLRFHLETCPRPQLHSQFLSQISHNRIQSPQEWTLSIISFYSYVYLFRSSIAFLSGPAKRNLNVKIPNSVPTAPVSPSSNVLQRSSSFRSGTYLDLQSPTFIEDFDTWVDKHLDLRNEPPKYSRRQIIKVKDYLLEQVFSPEFSHLTLRSKKKKHHLFVKKFNNTLSN